MSAATPCPRPGPATQAVPAAQRVEHAAPAAGSGLRAEHDALAERLFARRSIDLVRRGAYAGFVGFLASGLAVKLAFDRWFSTQATRFRGPPVFFFAALAVALVLVALACFFFVRARRHMREEDAQFARLQDMRRALGLDP